ncbi:MAG: cysteine--tRNA ligase [Spirochaetia bacterium]|nr:cysteine--tRNA ligase [Spirochaetia bacterium]
MSLTIYNSYTGRKETFKPADPKQVKIYNCGPTVYNLNHIGNFRSYIFVDLLRRYLKLRGYGLHHTSNITDIDDKIIDNALKEKKNIQEFTEPFIKAFLEDLTALKIETVEERPRATESIPDMIAMMKELEKNGHIYAQEGNVYFRISSFGNYGKLSKLDSENLIEAAQGRFEADEYDKENARDFALWKAPTKENEPSWDSPWGPGRPGWHLECSAMIRRIYGPDGIDIHLGGVDLLFPHHENEIAQSCCAFPGDNFVRYWMHNEHLLVDSKKMSKSLGNFYTLRDLTVPENAESIVSENRAPASLLGLIRTGKIYRALRYLLISFHYRTKLNFTFENLTASDSACSRIQGLASRLIEKLNTDSSSLKEILLKENSKENPGEYGNFLAQRKTLAGQYAKCFFEAMDDDLNIAKAIACVFEMIREINAKMDRLDLGDNEAMDALLFLYQLDRILDTVDFLPESRLEKSESNDELEKWVSEMIEKRIQARKDKDFNRADEIRDELLSKNIRLKDTPQGTVWEKA